MAQIEFIADSTDFSEIRTQLQSQLVNYDSWKGNLDVQTGTLLLDSIASLGAFALGKALRVYQDGYSETALSDRALYALAIKQGERINRKTPASITVQVIVPNTVQDPISIEPFEQFSGANTYWFNREQYTFEPGTTNTMVLYQGYVSVASNMGLNTNWQSFVSVENAFAVSNDDVAVYVDGLEIPVVQDLLSNYPSVAAVQDFTTGDGSLHLVFGTTEYGTRPTLSNTVVIKYAVTSGSAANNLAVANQTLVFSTSNSDRAACSLIIISSATGGADETPALQYKYTGNLSYGGLGSALNKQQIIQTINAYPGVVDCLTRAQREIDPTALELMNVIEIYLLTETDWDPPKTLEFIAYMHRKCIDPARFVLKSASSVLSYVNATVLCKSWADLGIAKAQATLALNNLYLKKKGIIGKDISLNDIHTALRTAYEGIDDVTLRQPTQNQIVSAQPIAHPTLSYDNGGTHSGSFSYAVGAILPDGIIAPLNWSSILAEEATTVTVGWDLYSEATNYIVYGRTGLDGFGPLVMLGPTVTSWTDDFSATPTGIVPTVSSVPVKYLTLDSTSEIDAIYSPRYRT